MTSSLKACFDIQLPAKYNEEAFKIALAENPGNRSPFEAAALKSKLWKPGRKITIGFLDGKKSVQERVKKFAKLWENVGNIVFDFVDRTDTEIRISFKQDGSWSALGTDCLVESYFPKDEPTMNYGWLTDESSDQDYSAVVLHEFGHALGMIHEHQNPANQIQWNKEAVYKALSGPPNNWEKPQIDHNMFEKYSHAQTQFTEFDPKSIMLYSFPAEWTLNNQAFKENTSLSENDKAFIGARYPKAALAVTP